MRLWGILRKNHKMQRQLIVPLSSSALDDVMQAMTHLCHEMDLACPIWLEKHEQELKTYGKTAFSASDFIETISFDRFELEILFDEKAQARRSNDPRNDFSTMF